MPPTTRCRESFAAKIENISFEQDVELAPGESKDVTFETRSISAIGSWPIKNCGGRHRWARKIFYPLELEFEITGKVSDRVKTKYRCTSGHRRGGRETAIASSRSTERRFFIRGGGWSPDMMLRENPARLEDEIRYTRDMGLNTIRLEGKLETEEFLI